MRGGSKPAFLRITKVKRQGFLAAGLLSSATALCLLLNRHGGLGASEEKTRSFREALAGIEEPAATEVEDGIRLNYFDTTWAKVIKDVAESQEMTLVMDSVPPGRFARRDKKQYDLDTAVRILNKELEPQGYRLLVQKSYLIVLNLDKARTEYSRPSIKPDGSTEQERTPATESLIRSASASRKVADDESNSASPSAVTSTSDRRQRKTGIENPRSQAKASDRSRNLAATEEESGWKSDASRSSIRPVSHGGKVVDEKIAEADQAGPMSVEEIPLNNGNASELARTIYVVFEKRAELQKNSVNGLPGFAVYDRAEDGSPRKDNSPLFRVGIDQSANQLVLEAPAPRMNHLKKLIGDLDKPAEFGAEAAVKVVENKGISAKTAKELNQQIHQLVSMADEGTGEPGALNDQKNRSDGELAAGDDPAINLRGEVNIQAMQELGILILKGNEADVAKVEEIIARLETMSVGSLPAIHVLTLQNVDSEAMAHC